MSTLPHYNLDDFIRVKRSDDFLSKRYKHWCLLCKKDRGYAYKNKIFREPLCHACKMADPDVLSKISNNSSKLTHTQESRSKISESLFKRYNSSPINRRIARNLRGRLNKAIRGHYKTGSAIKDLGCSIEQFKTYLESKFQEGMSWDNWGVTGWHIDHIKPLCSFNLQDPVELKKACHYSNLQPLWAKDNLLKRINDGTN